MRTCFLILALAVVLAPGSAGAAQDVAGDWVGTLSAPGGQLRLIVHLTRNASGALGGTLDSLDQGAMGIAITKASLTGSNLNLAIDAVHGSYDGKVNAAGDTVHGTWTQAGQLELTLQRVDPSKLDGAWAGTLDFGTTKLRIILHLATGPQGLIASLQSPDQGNAVIPASKVSLDAAGFVFEMDQVSARFAGKIDPSQTKISGTFTQSGRPVNLELTRVKDGADVRPPRPQNPQKPYPYREDEVSYTNPKANIKLAGTLTTPQGKGPFTAVLLITGSGPQDRDETIAGHKPFLVLADYLTRHGIAVLRADDRGVGQSGGQFASATTADFATDAEAGVAYLKTRPEIHAAKIGLIGHSEGGTIAPMVAARNRDVAFIVMLAGTGVTGDLIIVEQVRLIALANGATQLQAESLAARQHQITELVKSEQPLNVLKPKLRELLSDKPAAQIDTLTAELTSPWYRYFLSFDPATVLSKVTSPVLALNGEKDMQVPPALNLPAIRRVLTAAGNQHFEVVELPGLNHLFQHAKTGSPIEYGQIEETMAPEVLDLVAAWITKQ